MAYFAGYYILILKKGNYLILVGISNYRKGNENKCNLPKVSM